MSTTADGRLRDGVYAAHRASLVAVVDAWDALDAQQDRIDARFARWMTEGCPKGGAIAQRNMERKRDRLQWALDEVAYAAGAGGLGKRLLGDDVYWPGCFSHPEDGRKLLERALKALDARHGEVS